ncbi:metal ABC transporter permease [Pseudomonas putida]|nr:metal ABC transporter permease [Pseudomonas putida]
MGVLLFLTSPRQMFEKPRLYAVLSFIVNVVRSLPFIILIILLIPTTVVLVGTSLGVAGAIPPLVIGTVPFFARLVERALVPEALPGIIAAITVTTITLVSYTAMAGVVGAGGLGDLAIRYGYQRFQDNVMYVTVIILILMVQLLQMLGDRLVVHFSRK